MLIEPVVYFIYCVGGVTWLRKTCSWHHLTKFFRKNIVLLLMFDKRQWNSIAIAFLISWFCLVYMYEWIMAERSMKRTIPILQSFENKLGPKSLGNWKRVERRLCFMQLEKKCQMEANRLQLERFTHQLNYVLTNELSIDVSFITVRLAKHLWQWNK